jgi:hypothetical protein
MKLYSLFEVELSTKLDFFLLALIYFPFKLLSRYMNILLPLKLQQFEVINFLFLNHALF